jgi:hypothetical protein
LNRKPVKVDDWLKAIEQAEGRYDRALVLTERRNHKVGGSAALR